MLHHIDAAYHQATFSRSSCAWLTIDDVAIEQWLANHLNDPHVAKLGLSLMWLLDEDEDALAKRRFTPGEEGTSTIVPLLVCSDDMDFDCTVLVAEQVIEGDLVRWSRFGWSVSGSLEVGVSTRWCTDTQPISFALASFNAALEKLDMLVKNHRVSS
ncbi:hypothetical protein [Pseudomonas chlororaphis]|uniref:hypothetical protein n=1 Tax=Pseudomonas chlororaphis TaxID=587753 RepID=UPI000D0EEF28|nr:hypothetical protein [Pseudomonas chlororaphis]AVO59617.1 hypothetical protein C6Q18_17185 [Pseudomonas chlororaphis subsp. piscium]NNB43184.1 hypothetical protein [Pseudomonas chlororaphis]